MAPDRYKCTPCAMLCTWQRVERFFRDASIKRATLLHTHTYKQVLKGNGDSRCFFFWLLWAVLQDPNTSSVMHSIPSCAICRRAADLCSPWTSQGSPGCSSDCKRSGRRACSGGAAGRWWTSRCSRSTPCTGCPASSTASGRCPVRGRNTRQTTSQAQQVSQLAFYCFSWFSVCTWLFPSIISFSLFRAVRSCTAVRGSWLLREASDFLLPSIFKQKGGGKKKKTFRESLAQLRQFNADRQKCDFAAQCSRNGCTKKIKKRKTEKKQQASKNDQVQFPTSTARPSPWGWTEGQNQQTEESHLLYYRQVLSWCSWYQANKK